MRRRVDLPAPLGPTTPSTSPSATVREMPARIVAAPCALCRSRAMRVPATGAAYEPIIAGLVDRAVWRAPGLDSGSLRAGTADEQASEQARDRDHVAVDGRDPQRALDACHAHGAEARQHGARAYAARRAVDDPEAIAAVAKGRTLGEQDAVIVDDGPDVEPEPPAPEQPACRRIHGQEHAVGPRDQAAPGQLEQLSRRQCRLAAGRANADPGVDAKEMTVRRDGEQSAFGEDRSGQLAVPLLDPEVLHEAGRPSVEAQDAARTPDPHAAV